LKGKASYNISKDKAMAHKNGEEYGVISACRKMHGNGEKGIESRGKPDREIWG